jgi:hypothetical protein
MRERGRIVSGGRAVVCAAIFLATASLDASGQPTSCEVFAVEGLTLGATRGAVRAKLGRERSTTRIVREGRADATAATYGEGESAIYVEYDHRIDRRPEPRVVLLRVTFPTTDEALAALVEQWGAPAVWQDAATASPASVGPVVVWADARCGAVATVYRRTGEWWSGTGGRVLQVETLEAVRRGESPASPVLAPPPAP